MVTATRASTKCDMNHQAKHKTHYRIRPVGHTSIFKFKPPNYTKLCSEQFERSLKRYSDRRACLANILYKRAKKDLQNALVANPFFKLTGLAMQIRELAAANPRTCGYQWGVTVMRNVVTQDAHSIVL